MPGNIGLGKQSILQLAKHNPKTIYLGARTQEKALAAIAEIKEAVPNASIEYIHCDLADLSSVQQCAKDFTSKNSRLDILLLNAGIMLVPAALTKDGYETQFGTNHVGHALLTKLLLPTLLKTAEEPGADVRVISLSSLGHMFAPSSGISFAELKTPMASTFSVRRYGQSKLANILFASEMAKRYPSITTVAVHPGVVDTNLYQTMNGSWMGFWGLFGKVQRYIYTSVEDGAKNQLWAATAPRGIEQGQVKSGEYYVPVGIAGQGTKSAYDQELAEKLWTWTEKEIDGYKAE